SSRPARKSSKRRRDRVRPLNPILQAMLRSTAWPKGGGSWHIRGGTARRNSTGGGSWDNGRPASPLQCGLFARPKGSHNRCFTAGGGRSNDVIGTSRSVYRCASSLGHQIRKAMAARLRSI